MKQRLVPVNTEITNTKELFEALLHGKVLTVGTYDIELLPSGFISFNLDGLNTIAQKVTRVSERKELPWYECMEVGQTVLCKDMQKEVGLVTRKGKQFWTSELYKGGVGKAALGTFTPLTTEEVSKFAFSNVCN